MQVSAKTVVRGISTDLGGHHHRYYRKVALSFACLEYAIR